MAAVSVHQFAQCITCHAWSPDQSIYITGVAVKFHVSDYELGQMLAFLLREEIVHGYVWNQETTEWVPTLVILRLNRAALCVQWSPKGEVIFSGLKTSLLLEVELKLSVCATTNRRITVADERIRMWVSKLIRKRHDSSVTSVAWHPNNIFLATTSTDGKCRVFSTFIKGVDTRGSGGGPSDSKFGEMQFTYENLILNFYPPILMLEQQIIQLDLSYCWAFGVKWSPSGNTLAYVGHNSMIYFVDEVGPSPLAQSVAFRDLPLRDIIVYRSFLRFLGDKTPATSNTKSGSQFSEAFGKFYGQSKLGMGSNNVEPSRRGGAHDNCINCIVALKKSGDSIVTRFSTSVCKRKGEGGEGNIAFASNPIPRRGRIEFPAAAFCRCRLRKNSFIRFFIDDPILYIFNHRNSLTSSTADSLLRSSFAGVRVEFIRSELTKMFGRRTTMGHRVPSLVDLCVQVAIDNVRYLGDVGETDFHLLERILPHCTLEQLMHVEKCTEGRDLRPVTNELWKKFFERNFGTKSVNVVVERMKKEKVNFSWKQLYEAKLKALEDKERRISERVREGYKMEEAKKQNRQIRLCSKVPPSSAKRNFYGGSYGCISNTKSNIMKKAKLDFVNSREVKNLAAMKNKVCFSCKNIAKFFQCVFFFNIRKCKAHREEILEGLVNSGKILKVQQKMGRFALLRPKFWDLET
ncbi:hypothetical protein M9H77_21306 [Catharanthus roseus]|uniref:Uncharacterized protein n=1 Tax=Catharanthus roseus TaxID=4058 RepID=A0ACC0APW7_CATRO|nr:hypothetical protein M9H77_21306 [Catharanthus roseus]